VTLPLPVRVDLVGDAALLVTLGETLDLEVNARAIGLAMRLDARRVTIPGLRRAVPGHASVLVPFDPEVAAEPEIRAAVAAALGDPGTAADAVADAVAANGILHEIPVAYGGADGPDLAAVAAATGLGERDVVRLHAGAEHRVLVLGFVPGFAYLGGLPAALELPRRAEPRIRVPAGSVAIAGRQTGIYPFATPGGWHVIGRTEAWLWDPAADPPARFAPGDRVRFVAG
jgi:KipI family sensor histidine kinase inhibitor